MRCVRSYSTIKAVLLINIQTIANGIWNFYVYIINLPFICKVCICAEVLQCLAVYFPCEVKGSQIDSQPLHALPGKLSSLYIGLEVQILQYNNKKLKKYNPGKSRDLLKNPGIFKQPKMVRDPGIGNPRANQPIKCYLCKEILQF